MFFPIYLSNQRFENSMVLLLVINENKSHYVYIKDFDELIWQVYDDFQCNLKSAESYEDSCSKKYQHPIHYSFAYILISVDDKFSKNAAYKFIEVILKEWRCCKKVTKKHFNKNLIMTEEKGQQFQLHNTCSICEKRIEDENVRDVVLTNTPGILDTLRLIFSKSIFEKMMEKFDGNPAVQTFKLFKMLTVRRFSETRLLRHLTNHIFRSI